jgi:serine/tyrosine/threonine adenylyltransferase
MSSAVAEGSASPAGPQGDVAPHGLRGVAALRFDDRFVRELPGERVSPERDLRVSRPVADACYSPATPTPVPAPRLLILVPEVARLLDLATDADDAALVEVLAGNRLLPGMSPYAACYGGHQFGSWAGQLGDGRAITLGEVLNGRGERWEVQLKGAGPTAYSRRADGRAVLRSSVRELVCSEAMHHLGVPTTRALSLVTTGAGVMRDMLYDGNPQEEPGAVVCRVAPSFLRFGNFEIHAARGDLETLRTLVDFTGRAFFPTIFAGSSAGAIASPAAVAAMFTEICLSTARLMVDWMRVGFVHGVMNTDNMSILGLTIDYGPYGWLEGYDPGWTPNITDASGRRYRFGNQPGVARWNLAQLANALLPLVGEAAPLEEGIARFTESFVTLQRQMMLDKLGLVGGDATTDEDDSLVTSLQRTLAAQECDMTQFFRSLARVSVLAESSPQALFDSVKEAYYGPDAAAGAAASMGSWLIRYAARAREELHVGGQPSHDPGEASSTARVARMNAVNPIYVPRNYLVQVAIDRAEEGDLTELRTLMDVLRRPYEEQVGREAYAARRPEWARHRAGCSMLSCSS